MLSNNSNLIFKHVEIYQANYTLKNQMQITLAFH